MPVELETERLILRQWRSEDLEPMATFLADEKTARFIGGVCDRVQAWRKLAVEAGHWVLRGYGMWAVEEKASGAFTGFVGLWFPDFWPELELGWSIMPDKQGFGYATEAALRSRAYAYDVVGANSLVSYIHPENEPSKRVAQRLGATLEGQIELLGATTEVYRHPPPPT